MKTEEKPLRTNELNIIALLSGMIRELNETRTTQNVSDLIIKTANDILSLPLPQQESERSAEEFAEKRWQESQGEFSVTNFMEGFKYASQFKLLPVPSVTITDEEIKKWANSLDKIEESIQSNSDKIKENIKSHISNEEPVVSKWIREDADKIIEKQVELIELLKALGTFESGSYNEIEQLESELSFLQSKETIK